MIYKHTHKPLFILLLILSVSNISFSQKLKIDTVYYNRSGQVVSQESDYLTYSIMQLNRGIGRMESVMDTRNLVA